MTDEQKIEQIIEDNNETESTKTVLLYFANLISFIFVMLIYYGLLIIIIIAVLVHWYDYTYNYEEFMSNIIRGV